MTTIQANFTNTEIDYLKAAGLITADEEYVLRMAAPVEFDGEVKPVLSGGPDIPWREWVPQFYLRRQCAPFAEFHENLWEWFESIELDKKSESAVVPWARGLGKSSSLEGGILRTCVKGTRRFWIYVSRTLEDANNHVMAMARAMERMGIERQVSKYGLATGWNAQKLRTSSGFSILSFGLDAGARGVKLDDVRPDGIALDDVDFLGDTMEAIEKKIRTISGTILQAGSPSFVTIFVQNPIAAHSVFSRVLDGRAGILTNRNPELAKLIPAIYDFEYETYFNDQGLECAKITGGTSSWEGKSLDDWQYQIEIAGIDAFLIECQHQIHIGTRFFGGYTEENHHVPAEHTPIGIDGPDIPTWYTVFGGFDWGYKDLSAFSLNATDERGCVRGLASWELNQLSNDALADKVCATLAEWGIEKANCLIYADGSMWAEKTINGAKAEADVEAFYRKGLRMVKCEQGPQSNRFRNNAIVTYLAQENMYKLYRGYNHCSDVGLKNASPERHDARQVLHNIYSHIISAIGHALNSRPKASRVPQKAKTAEDLHREFLESQANRERDLREHLTILSSKKLGYVPKMDGDEIERNENGEIVWELDKRRR